MDALERAELARKSPSPFMHVMPRRLAVKGVVIDRNPCLRCGTRGDLGCKHQVRG
jgi:hypothetical protein